MAPAQTATEATSWPRRRRPACSATRHVNPRFRQRRLLPVVTNRVRPATKHTRSRRRAPSGAPRATRRPESSHKTKLEHIGIVQAAISLMRYGLRRTVHAQGVTRMFLRRIPPSVPKPNAFPVMIPTPNASLGSPTGAPIATMKRARRRHSTRPIPSAQTATDPTAST